MSDRQGQGNLPDSGADFGKYRIVRKLGSGSYGVVYEALMPGPMGFAKPVALKMLRSHVVDSDEKFVKAMVNEARIGGLLHHANIVDVIEFGREGPHYYLAMEYVDGLTLEQVIAHCHTTSPDLPRFAVLDLTLQVCRGLHYAHGFKDRDGNALDLIHRDLKPGNIMVDRQGVARILDFGIAKAASNLSQSTITGVIKGTPQYLSPDQLVGERPLLPRSDVFALGAVLYELVIGQPLFRGKNLKDLIMSIMRKDLAPHVERVEETFPGMGAVVGRALDRDGSRRYPDARTLAQDVRKLCTRYPAEDEMADVFGPLFARIDRGSRRDIQDSDDLRQDIDQETRAFASSITDVQTGEVQAQAKAVQEPTPPPPSPPPRPKRTVAERVDPVPVPPSPSTGPVEPATGRRGFIAGVGLMGLSVILLSFVVVALLAVIVVLLTQGL